MACLWHKDKFQQGHCNFRGNTDGWEVVSKAVEGEVVFYVTSIKAKIVCPIDQQLDTHKKTEILINGKVLNINLSLKLNTKILKNGAKKENYRRWGLWMKTVLSLQAEVECSCCSLPVQVEGCWCASPGRWSVSQRSAESVRPPVSPRSSSSWLSEHQRRSLNSLNSHNTALIAEDNVITRLSSNGASVVAGEAL